ncbi:uncharacterized protein PODANS_6_100 [Podospora anserina S mat+]|uniref:Podospora anserina S mat+ genomic DNA chromosome 6, supercontig 2 n=1 Tax=Podospora anserina (strain S / ATCC MYA-4624 / DSM 980 / FGSC 10383) TaxID=515849 RepID=B2B3G2_PODAN|nr:uncharacterized protein PODANS_6_100 [Podospora anserina S mat+]CAP71648.1 unnamed protein product [Podospora anserina S mat+]CDP31041.1 Putative protein of unknown function [Podospora anserina S mat+]
MHWYQAHISTLFILEQPKKQGTQTSASIHIFTGFSWSLRKSRALARLTVTGHVRPSTGQHRTTYHAYDKVEYSVISSTSSEWHVSSQLIGSVHFPGLIVTSLISSASLNLW